MFYVYEWYIVETNEIIYVGKGTHNRYKVKKHNNLFNEMIKRFNCSSRIVKEFDNEKDAFQFEYERITELKNKNQCVCNISMGGCGGTTECWTEDKRKRYSDYNVMKSECQRERMSKQNPMKNQAIASRVNAQKRKAVIIGEKEYPSISQACNELNVTSETIKHWCNKGINKEGKMCRYKGTEQIQFQGKRYNKSGCRPLTYKGKHYEASLDLAKELGVNESTIYEWTKKGFDSNGNVCRYDDDNRVLEYKPNKYCQKAVIVNGVRYSSITSASKEVGVSVDTIRSALKHKHKTKLICEYDNQKPSQEKTNNSILEGSTTNE